MSTVGQVRAMFSGQYARCEFFKPVVEQEIWTANGLRRIDGEAPDEAEVLDHRLFNEFDYNITFWMPFGESMSFRDEFGDEKAQVLCIALPRSGLFLFKRRKRIGQKIRTLYMPANTMEEAGLKADAAILLGVWHKYLDLKEPENVRVYEEREAYYNRKGRYP